MFLRIFIYFACASIAAVPASAAVIYFSVQNYHGRANNPFFNIPNLGIVYLEDFETQFDTASNTLTTPYATGWNGSTIGATSWGVQQDYSLGDSMGWTWSDASRHEEWSKSPSGLHFDFVPDIYGRLPEYAGAAILGYPDMTNAGGLFNTILVYDKNGNEITNGLWKLPAPLFSELEEIGPENYFSNFAGIYVPGGISRIQFRDFLEVDHLTYGYAPLPEPGTLSLAGLAAVGLLLGRRPRG